MAQQAMAEAIRAMARRHAEAAEHGVEVLSLPQRALWARLQEDEEAVLTELAGLPVVSLLRLAKAVTASLVLAMKMERLALGEPDTVVTEHTTVESADVHAVVETPNDAERLREVAAILQEAGALDFGTEDDAEVPT